MTDDSSDTVKISKEELSDLLKEELSNLLNEKFEAQEIKFDEIGKDISELRSEFKASNQELNRKLDSLDLKYQFAEIDRAARHSGEKSKKRDFLYSRRRGLLPTQEECF